MKFILNKDNLTVDIQDEEIPNSGSIKYYEAEVEFDESWEGLVIEARIANREYNQYADEGNAIAVIDNRMYIDKSLSGAYGIGFIGYRVENNTKTYQISTNLAPIYFNKGAGEIEITNGDTIPDITEWEIYIAQLQEYINRSEEIIDGANNLDVDSDGETLTITKKDGTTKEVNVKGKKGDCNFATFEVNSNMELVMNKTEDMLLEFNLNENSELEVII